MPWTEADTEAYWRELRALEAREAQAAGRARDPLGWQFALLTAPEPEPEPEPYKGPLTRGAFWRAVTMLPLRDRRVFEVAMARAGGRSGDGVACARVMGCIQPRWVAWLDYAEARLAVVAPFALPDGGGWDLDRVAEASPYPTLVRDYLSTWNTNEAARRAGTRQSTTYGRLLRCGPVVEAVLRRPVLR